MSLNNQHAAILRDFAAEVNAAIEEYAELIAGADDEFDTEPYRKESASNALLAAALLAGAEALEALTVIADGEGDAQVIARQALARLEGK